MSKRNKIIVSIVGITIVLLALLGITYAYYLTRIEGNTNTNSISITTADLKLVFSDGNEIVTQTNIMPGTTIGEKTFSVSNTGNSTIKNYKVVLEYAVIENVVPSVFVRPGDFEITLTCVSKNIETNEVSGTCSGYTGTWNNESFEMTLNDIEEGIKHEYSLTIFYANPDVDQSDDMGKNLNLKVQIYGENETSTITGTINNVDETYAMKLNSNPKISTIKNVGTKENPKYQYKFIGVEHNKDGESHTLTLINKSDVVESTGNITINKGTNANISGSTITVKDNQTNIYLTTGSGSSTLTNSATFNPYSDNTNSLAYHIINNSINNANGTEYRDVPLSVVAASISNYGTGNFELYDTFPGWGGVTYGDTQNEADEGKNYIDADSDIEACEKVKGKYISDAYMCLYDCIPYGLVKDCSSEGVPYVEINEPEKTLSYDFDDYSMSFYYRGAVLDNYVNFAGMCWRIVRIAGDGSIKIILEDQYTTCDDTEEVITTNKYTGNWIIGTGNYGYEEKNVDSDSWNESVMNYLNPVTNSSNSMAKSFYDFQTNKLYSNLNKLKSGDWCLNDILYSRSNTTPFYYTRVDKIDYSLVLYYDAVVRLSKNNANEYHPTIKCNGTKLSRFEDVYYNGNKIITESEMYVGTITADEIVYAGGKYYVPNYDYYLVNDYQQDAYMFWTITPHLSSNGTGAAFRVGIDGFLAYNTVDYDKYIDFFAFRPMVNLKSGTTIWRGDGTQNNPYVIE